MIPNPICGEPARRAAAHGVDQHGRNDPYSARNTKSKVRGAIDDAGYDVA